MQQVMHCPAIAMRVAVLLLAIFFMASPLLGAEIRNLRTGQQENRAFAVYDLQGKPGEKTADVRVELEIGGERYDAGRLSLSGDFGKGVKIGVGKYIYWDLIKDLPGGFEGEVFWNVETTLQDKKATVEMPASSSTAIAAPDGQGMIDQVTRMEFVKIPAGCFQMGDFSGRGESDERPVHEVCLDAFYIGKYEVTQEQWQTVMGANPAFFKQCGNNCPVENVSWSDALRFIKKLNGKSGRNYRLPTEAEWEYAARSAGRSEVFAGTNATVDVAGWYETNSGNKTHQVGQKQPNGLGLFDMSGNVAEWVQDLKGDYAAGKVKNPAGSNSGNNRVARGGSWLDDATGLRTSYRSELGPKVRTNLFGFRLLLPTL
jgi:formylglycine-generating enzyme required for sulfatase activity